jgi:protein O-GlcNAc transferase
MVLRRLGRLVGSALGAVISARIEGPRSDPLDVIPRRRIHGLDAVHEAGRLEAQASGAEGQGGAAWVACAWAWFRLDEIERARAAFERALAIDPANPAALDGLGTLRKSAGDLAGAIAAYRQALEIAPTSLVTFQNLLFALLCSADTSEREILEWHTRFSERFERPLGAGLPAHVGERDPSRRLRIGYVSADLRDHVTGRCVAPLLAAHDRDAFDVRCYFDGRRADDFTREMQRRGGTWCDMAPLDDATLVERIRGDGVDILVDLSGHTPGNRLLAFARRPAPVQVSYLDYSATTGLKAMDYRLTTASCDREGFAEAFYTETLYRLPHTCWIYNPPVVPDIAPVASRAGNGGLLLACLNSFYRVTDPALRTWGGILRRLPHARLALVGVPGDDAARRRIARRFESLGVDASRVEMFGILNYGHYIQLVRATDIALAPFPYNGAMTTFDCLSTGVPVVCLRGGGTFRSSMGDCILGLVGLERFVAKDLEAYARTVVELARNADALRDLRTDIPKRMARSPIRDAPALAREIETAYRLMWRRHCAGASS